MNKWYVNILMPFLLLLLLIGLPSLVNAQIINPGCDPLDPKCPIDGGLSLLIAAGAGYGIKKIRDSRKKDAAEL